MKRFILSLVAAFLMLQLSAQQPNISNPGFEQWSGTTPTGWTTSISGSLTGIPIMGSYPLSFNFGSRVNDSHSGSYALKLQTKSLDLSMLGVPVISVPGIAQLGTAGSFSISIETIQELMSIDSTTDMSDLINNLDLDELSTFTNIFSRGEPFTMVPTAMKVWVKYLPPVGETDTMLVLLGAYKEGQTSLLLMGDMPDTYGYYAVTERLEDYTQLTVPVSYDEEDLTCDSLVIVFVSSSFTNAKSTELYIDDISFEFDYLSVNSTERIQMNMYPNPTTDYMVISPANQSESYDIMVYDMNGKQLKSVEQLTGDTRLSVSDLAAGAYFLKLKQSGSELVRKFVVE
ncbi:MAG: T9SS type A sorting domain-containing protein [Bacteroidales bacterium]|nr:T9SS type A sorting domain-containing protein [Bacteroidales bacterium]